MKKLQLLFLPTILALAFGLMLSCSNTDDTSTATDDTSTSTAITVSGKVQKGPYVQGTEITVRELDSSMIPTGNTFTGTIDDNTGSFSIKGTLTNKIVELAADGFYFNEVSGSLSSAKLSLQAFSDLTDSSSVNVNLMTHLEKKRVEYLMDNSKMTFAAAKTQAQTEILKIFYIYNITLGNSETLDISKSGDGNAALLAISAMLQSDKTDAELTELLSNINTDIRTDGTMDSSIIRQTIITAKAYVKNRLSTIRSNIENRYNTLGISANVPSFETFINQIDGPIVEEVTAVTTPTTDSTPSYTFSSTGAGTINYGGSCSSSTTAASSGNNTIDFSSPDGVYNDCTIMLTDISGNPGNTISVTSFTVDTTIPTVTSVSSNTSNGSYKASDNISITVTFNETVFVDNSSGNPRIQLETGTTDQYATYTSGNSSNVLVFNYTVQSGDSSSDLDYKSSNSFSLNSGTIKDIMNYDATLTLPSPGSSGSLSANKAIIIDNTAPTSPSISIDNATYSTSIALTLSATDAVGVTGYYASESSTAPSVSASGWSSVASATSYSGNASFTLSSAVDNKTVYVWFKDAAGNVSTSASDNITYSTTVVISRTGTDMDGSTHTSSNLEWQIVTASENDGLSSGLTWTNGTLVNWDNAAIYCTNLELASKTDWRLPTKTELASLIDMSQTPKIVSSLVSITESASYYSFTHHESDDNGFNNVEGESLAYYVNFNFGYLRYNLKTYNRYFRCVRP